MVNTTTSTENHKIVVMEHELVVQGVQLTERKQMTHVTSDDPSVPPKNILVHTRSIGDRSYEVKEVKLDGEVTETTVNTTLTNGQIQQFQADWLDMWCPTITDEQIANNQFAVDDQSQQKQQQQRQIAMDVQPANNPDPEPVVEEELDDSTEPVQEPVETTEAAATDDEVPVEKMEAAGIDDDAKPSEDVVVEQKKDDDEQSVPSQSVPSL